MQKQITFSSEVKEEICSFDYSKSSSIAILSAIFRSNLNIVIRNSGIHWELTTQFEHVIRLVKKLLINIGFTEKFQIKFQINHLSNNSKNYKLCFDEHLDEIEKKLNLKEDFYKLLKTDSQKKGFIIGSFLSSGSVFYLKNKTSYHFEIRSYSEEYLIKIQKIFKYFGIESKIINYRKNFKLYIKRVELISDVLKLIGAEKNMYKLEDWRIRKDFSNSIQRLTNLEVSNIKKTLKASDYQISIIKKIKKRKLDKFLDEKSKAFIECRIKNPELSLADLTNEIKKIYNINIPRTSFNHIVKRLEKLLLKD